MLEQVREATEPGPDGVVRTAELVVAHLGAATDGAPATSVGLGIPGLVDVERGAVKHAVNLGVDGEWVPLRAELEARLGVPVAVENDVNVATLGAVALSGIRDLVYLSIGTGLAAGLVLDGTPAPRRDRRGRRDRPRADRPARRGCASAASAAASRPSPPAGRWPRPGRSRATSPPAQALFAAAAAGDPRAIEVRDRFAAGVADAVRTLCLTVDPATIVLGGGVAHLGAPLVDAVVRRAARAGRVLAVPGLARPGRPDPGGPRRPAGRGDRGGPAGSCTVLMEVVPLASADEVAALAADTIEALVRARPACVLGLATGSSPVPTYAELVARHRAGTGPSYDEVRAFLLDEYVGLPPGHPQSYRATIARELTDDLGLPADRVHGPDPTDVPTAGAAYEAQLVAAGGVDLQVLGIGSDGHLAFNEPGSSLSSTTRIKTLTEQTRRDNARFFGSLDEVPHHVLTQGLGTILRARHLLLIATGAAQGRRGRGGRRGPAHAPPAPPRSSSSTRTPPCSSTPTPPPGWSAPTTTARSTPRKPDWQGL